MSLFACMLTASAKQNLAQPPAPVIKPPQNRQRLKLFRAVTSTFPPRTCASVTSSINPGQEVTVSAVAVAIPGQDITLSAVAVAACPVRSVDMSKTYPDREAPVLVLQQDGPVPDNVCKNIAT